MERLGHSIGVALAIALVLGGPVLVVLLFWKASANAAALVALVIGLLGATVGAIQFVRERRREHDRARRTELGPIYEAFFQHLYGATKQGLDQETAEAAMLAFVQKVIFWSSEDVVRAVLRWRAAGASADVNPRAALEVMGDLLLALRHDLGHRDDVSRDDLLALFINDYLPVADGRSAEG